MRSAQFFDNLNDAVRENPVAAGLIGVGLAWMVFGGSRTVVRDARGAVQTAKDTVETAAETATGAVAPVAGVVDQARRTATDMSDAISERVKVAASAVSDAVATGSVSLGGSETHSESYSGGSAGPSRAREVADFLERQPLALAALGITVGAAIAAAFPKTAAEDRFVGNAGETLRQKAGQAASTISDRVAAAMDAATEEAFAQDLTLAAAQGAIRAAATKVKNVTKAGVDAGQGG